MATIKDIAKKAGVSAMTVSRAFNKPEVVKDELRERILEVAAELKYVPNQAARSLVGNKTGVVRIVTQMDPSDFYFSRLFSGAANVLSDNGYSIMISHDKPHEYEYDGAIFMGLGRGEDKKIYETIHKPFVIFGKSELPVDWVDVDNIGGTEEVTQHLIDMGHRKIGIISVNTEESFSEERYLGFKKSMHKNGLAIDEKAVFNIEHSLEAVRRIGEEALSQDVTAFVCESDVLAYGMVDYAKHSGRRVPEDISVVGFDGMIFNVISIPHITTARQHIYEMGMTLGRVLMDRMKDPSLPPQRVMIPTSFESGGSVLDLR